MSFSRVSSGGVYHPVSIRIASHGHASTQRPQKMHRSMSMSNLTGYFSTFGSGDSPATIVMHTAGHAVEQQKHATHRGDPSGRFISRCRPRNRGGVTRRTSGYSIVGMFSCRTMLRRRCPIVTPSPFTISTRYSTSPKDIFLGRATFFTPIVISFVSVSPDQEQDQPRRENVEKRQRQHHLTPQAHHLVVPQPRDRPPDPDEEPCEEDHLGEEGADPEEEHHDSRN